MTDNEAGLVDGEQGRRIRARDRRLMRPFIGAHRRIIQASSGRVLVLGCGAGVPVACDLTTRGHAVVGVDGSAQQVVRARRDVPNAVFLEADMCV